MTATGTEIFRSWLNEKLRELNTDENVFGSYILGILEGDESSDEKKEAIEGILSEVNESQLEEVVSAILNKWNESHSEGDDATKKETTYDVDEQLTKLLEAQKLQATVKERQYTEEERRIKEQILAQYSQTPVSDCEDDDIADDEADKKASTASSMTGIERNTNAQDVLQLQKERREQARLDSAAKKQKDKEDREKQKQLREEKKEKRKTVKSERRR